jgi:ligand-binding SRPBCC domain-containing protein
MRLLFETELNTPQEKIIAGFDRELFIFLSPPGVKVDLVRFDGCKKGDEVHLHIRSGGLQQEWVSLITEDSHTAQEWSFVDEGKKLPWPLKKWRHHHRVLSTGDKTSKIIDDINFECALGLSPLMYPILWASFAVRPGRYRKFFQG